MATWLHASLQDGGLSKYGLHTGLSNLGLFSGASLDLRFADTKSLADAVTGRSLVTFTRASSATYVGSDGLIKTATTNLLVRSEEFTLSPWTLFGTASRAADVTTAPNGTLTADSVTLPASSGIFSSTAAAANTTYTFSIWIRCDSTQSVRILINTNLNDPTTKTVTATTAWQRFDVTKTTSVGTTSWSAQVDTGGGNTFYLWGAQLEQSSTVGEYIPTTSTINSAPRFDHNPTTGESLGLLVEESRTNLVTYSACDVNWAADSSATYNLGLSALGLFSGVQVNSGGQIWHTIFRPGINLTASVAYAFTVFYRAGTSGRARITFRNNTLTTETVLTGSVGSLGVITSAAGSITVLSQYLWSDGLTYVITGTFTPGATSADHWIRIGPDSTTAGQTVIALGAQLEAGSFPTSYIPTTTATVTRSADVASITGSNFSSWYRQDEGTVFVESRVQDFTVTTFSRIASLDRGDATSNFAAIVRSSALNRVEYSVFAGTGQAVGLQPAITFAGGSTLRSAFVYKTDDFIAAANGTLSPADTLGTMPTAVTTLGIGMQGNGGLPYNGTIRRLVFFPQRLPNSTIQALTQ